MAGNLSALGFGGQKKVTSLPCGFSGALAGIIIAGPALTTLSGTTSAGTSNLVNLINVPTAARLNALMVSAVDVTSRDVRVVIKVDGTTVFDNTLTALADTDPRVAVGQVGRGTNLSLLFQPIDANNSLLVQFGCSRAETNKLSFSYNYEVRG